MSETTTEGEPHPIEIRTRVPPERDEQESTPERDEQESMVTRTRAP